MKKSFSAGLVILLPLALSIWVVKYLFDLFTDPLYGFIEKLFLSYEIRNGILHHHDTLVNLFSRITALALTLLLILILGYCGRKFFLHSLMQSANKLIFKLPVIGALYRLTKDIAKAMLSSEEKTFKASVLVAFPSAETYAIGLVTGKVPEKLKKFVASIDSVVFVPTAPHPISGYVLFCPESAIKTIPVSVEETFKFLISCGVVHPPSL